MKRFISMLTVLSLLMTISMPAMAAEKNVETEKIDINEEVDYLNYDFPEDAVILYQGEDGVIYQSNEGVDGQATTYSQQYNDVWLPAGKYVAGEFTVKNPHTIINRTYGHVKVESTDSQADFDIYVIYNSIGSIGKYHVKPSSGEVNIDFRSTQAEIIVKYYPNYFSSKAGARVLCHLF